MGIQWREDKPIYLQLRERVVRMILDGRLTEGEALPSVRNVASELQVNPITVMKAYQSLVDDGIVEKQRGKGMFCVEGAKKQLLLQEKEQFLDEEWPRILQRIENLNLTVEELMSANTERNSE